MGRVAAFGENLMDQQTMQRITLVMPGTLRERIEAERQRMSEDLGVRLSANAAVQAMVSKYLDRRESRG